MSTPQQTVLFDVPGPKAKRTNLIISIVGGALLLAIVAWIILRFAQAGQFAPDLWSPFLYRGIWAVLLEGVWATLKVAIVATVFSMVLGMLFATLRLSDHKWVRVPATIFVEVFRALPVLLLIFFPFYLGAGNLSPFWAVVIGLSLYNGMVIAEILRAGIKALPKGQKEAAESIGLRKYQAMTIVLLPQAIRAMMPTIIAQIVVILKDSALGYMVTYRDLLSEVNNIGRDYMNLLPSFIVGAAVYITINLAVSWLANYIERRGLSKSPVELDEVKAPLAAKEG